MSAELESVKRELRLIRSMLSEVLHKNPDLNKPKRITEAEAMVMFHVTRSKLKTMRLGYYQRGVWHDPVLFKWGHRNGRNISYDVSELEEVLKPTLAI